MSDINRLPDLANLDFVESLYEQYLADPTTVDGTWRRYFAELANGSNGNGQRNGHTATLAPSFKPASVFNPGGGAAGARHVVDPTADEAHFQHRIDELIRAYRVRGHIAAHIDPLMLPRPRPSELDPAYYGFSEEDMDRPFRAATMRGSQVLTLREILQLLHDTYCRFIGAQFMHIDDLSVRTWLQDRMESSRNRIRLGKDEQLRILTRLTDAVIFEDFIQKKFIGAKSFSLEGGESLIPLLDLAISQAGDQGCREVVLGMAHRGRLNVLANIMGKNPQQIFREFADLDPERNLGRGDVKYHLGYSSEWTTPSGRKVHLSLCFNPSHLEFVGPVALGRMRAKQDRHGDVSRREGMTLLIHGDASFAGEGVVQETLNLSQLQGYSTGGTVHVIVNNQIGFTTDPHDGRSTTYASDVAKMLQSPIFHVNGEDPESVAQVVQLALDFRQTFARDVVIDMYCYRRRGHNEGDEPAFTQPLLYGAIERRKSVRAGYLEHLLRLGEVTKQEADAIAFQRQEALEAELAMARSEDYAVTYSSLGGIWKGYRGGPASEADDPDTRIEQGRLVDLAYSLVRTPDDFHPHPKIARLLETRLEMARSKRPVDWGMAECLAFASVASDGLRIRLSGQDVQRGTFSHRHAVLHDVEDGHTFTPLRHIAHNRVELVNSPLSEVAVLGFDYGYSLDCPDGLVIWEAQFGDFVNVAQVMIDQFIASAEDKWRRLSKVVLLLPHGMEGMGPEHSSARPERFMNLCAEDNIQVCWPSSPKQIYHLLRRQALRRWSKPLIVMTPKSLLRHPAAVSPLSELANGQFEPVIADVRQPVGDGTPGDGITRVLLCSGKIYYELEERRRQLERDDVAILRIEQLYPFPDDELHAALTVYPTSAKVFWVQDEPENMGPWRNFYLRFPRGLFGTWSFDGIYRRASASPATGSAAAHRLEQERLLMAALGGPE